jgi:long-chain acyl-CoA synthetase
MFNLSVILRETATALPDHAALTFEGGSMSYRELDEYSDACAEGLIRRGLRPGDTVGLQLPNVPAFPIAYFGILKAGGVVVPLNVLLTQPEIAYHLGDAGAQMLITWAGVAEQAVKGAADAGVPTVVVAGAPASVGGVAFDELLAAPSGSRPMVACDANDTAVIIYTSGTTGRPKGAELTHIQLYMQADLPARAVGVSSDDVILTVLPLFHVFALCSILNLGVRFGCTLSLVPRFSAEAVLTAIQRDRATIFDGVPTMFIGLLSHPHLDSYDFSSLRLAVSGGAPIPADVLDAFERRFGVVILEGYGLSETTCTATQNRSATDRRVYSVGKPLWGTELEVWDDNGRALPRGKENVGELVTRGYHVMKGYHGQPEATAAAFAGGWFHTGDLGYIDEDGYVFIVDRKKELILRGGYNVYPREVEEVLHAHPAVAIAAVIGIPDDRLGEEVKAYVVTNPGAQVSAQELIAFCRERLAAYKYPRHIEFRESLPLSGAGKVQKLLIRDTAEPKATVA